MQNLFLAVDTIRSENKMYLGMGQGKLGMIDVRDIAEAVGEATINAGWGEWGVKVMMDYSRAYSEGWGDFTTDDIETITGKKARSIQHFYSEVLSHALRS